MTEIEVKKLLLDKKLSWDDFMEWMRGQTVGINDDGTTDFYDCDVNRFIRNRGRKDNVFEWD